MGEQGLRADVLGTKVSLLRRKLRSVNGWSRRSVNRSAGGGGLKFTFSIFFRPDFHCLTAAKCLWSNVKGCLTRVNFGALDVNFVGGNQPALGIYSTAVAG